MIPQFFLNNDKIPLNLEQTINWCHLQYLLETSGIECYLRAWNEVINNWGIAGIKLLKKENELYKFLLKTLYTISLL